jgi:hypothetical protein
VKFARLGVEPWRLLQEGESRLDLGSLKFPAIRRTTCEMGLQNPYLVY